MRLVTLRRSPLIASVYRRHWRCSLRELNGATQIMHESSFLHRFNCRGCLASRALGPFTTGIGQWLGLFLASATPADGLTETDGVVI
jgi:hypothetical protein